MRPIALMVIAALMAGVAAGAAAERRIEFSGYEWIVRRSDGLEGPGPNAFRDDEETVRVDEDGALRLVIHPRGRGWVSAEVILDAPVGYGTYGFQIETAPAAFDPPVILGLFTYDESAPDEHYREIDVELGRFGDADAPTTQYVLQPPETEGNRTRFDLKLDGTHSTHAFRWAPQMIDFASAHGHQEDILDGAGAWGSQIAFWSIEGPRVPEPGNERLRINFWLYRREAPTRTHEAVIRSFRFVPADD